MKRLPFHLSLTAGASLCACSSISGLDATSEYACKAPEGVRCESVSGTYHNALQNNLPAQRQRSEAAPASEPAATSQPVLPTSVSTPIAASPIRSQPKVLRLWIKPWEDADRDLHDEGYVYVQIDPGRWLVERAQRPLRDAFAPIRAPRNPGGAADAKAAAARQPAVPAGASSPVAEALRALQSGSAEGER